MRPLPIPDQRERECKAGGKAALEWEAAKGGVTMSTLKRKVCYENTYDSYHYGWLWHRGPVRRQRHSQCPYP